jgi:hypothetical protein
LDSAPHKSINLAKIFKKFSTTVKMQACVIDTNLTHINYEVNYYIRERTLVFY